MPNGLQSLDPELHMPTPDFQGKAFIPCMTCSSAASCGCAVSGFIARTKKKMPAKFPSTACKTVGVYEGVPEATEDELKARMLHVQGK